MGFVASEQTNERRPASSAEQANAMRCERRNERNSRWPAILRIDSIVMRPIAWRPVENLKRIELLRDFRAVFFCKMNLSQRQAPLQQPVQA